MNFFYLVLDTSHTLVVNCSSILVMRLAHSVDLKSRQSVLVQQLLFTIFAVVSFDTRSYTIIFFYDWNFVTKGKSCSGAKARERGRERERERDGERETGKVAAERGVTGNGQEEISFMLHTQGMETYFCVTFHEHCVNTDRQKLSSLAAEHKKKCTYTLCLSIHQVSINTK